MSSVIIPAHNEASVLRGTLRSLIGGDALDPASTFEVVVVCNACTDETADVARSFPGVRVVETSVPGKPNALNLGDSEARSWPRIYVDADVQMPAGAVRSLTSALDRPDPHAASLGLTMDTHGSSRAVQHYFKIWTELPVIRSGVVGRGVYAVNQAGHDRFGTFPAMTADDLYVHRSFAPHERTILLSLRSTVHAPTTFRALVTRKVRSFAGISEMDEQVPVAADESSGGWLGVIRRQPRLVAAAPAYVAVSVMARIGAYRKRRKGDSTWERDETSRLGRP